jgi:hypothetical protein
VLSLALAVAFGAGSELGAAAGHPASKRHHRGARHWAPLPRDFIGMNSNAPLIQTARGGRRQLAAEAAAGVRIVRVNFSWAAIEVRRGFYDFAGTDAAVADAAANHLDVLPVLIDAPRFLNGRGRQIAPPRRPAAIRPFARALARRYGRGGSFWRQHPGLPRRPIRWWEIWNEPNLPLFWGSRPNPRRYVRLLAAARAGIVAVDRKARVLSAPLSPVAAPDLIAYVRGMYRAGARGKLDAFGLNAYAPKADGVLGVVALVHGELRRLDPGMKIWLTEFGWATGHHPSPYTTLRRGQARRVHRALYRLAHKRHALGLRGVVYYDWRDGSAGGRHHRHDSWVLHTGLHNYLGEPKPALRAFRRTALSLTRAAR